MPLGTEVDPGPGDIVLDGDPAPPKKEHISPHFAAHVYCGQTVGWIRMLLGMAVGLSPGHTVLDEDSAPPRKGAQQPPTFWATSIVTKRSPTSATAELLLHSSPFSQNPTKSYTLQRARHSLKSVPSR